jgi:hypothetical protein
MKKWIIFPVVLFLFSCKGKQPESYFTPEKAIRYFKEVEDACNRDNGKLWGKNLYGPIIFVDRNTRKIITNFPDNEGLLKEKDGVYSGNYAKELIINNSVVTFGGMFFAMTPLPAEEDEYRIVTRSIHSLFHRYQEITGNTSSGNITTNMDENNARLWIKLEWKALRKALTAQGEEQQLAIRDALVFRGANHEFYQKYVKDEIKFEDYEGLATFTYTLLATNTPEEFNRRLLENLDRIYSMQSYSRSYGSIHGALYAALLYRKGFDFTTIRSENVDLGELTKKAYNIQTPAICRDVAGSLALNYDLETIRNEESKREADIRDRILQMTSTFTEKPVVFLELESPYFDYELEDIHAMDTLGTLYSKLRVSDNWGKLSVEGGGCLVSNNFKFLRITAKGFKTDKNRFVGEGWMLLLNNEWELVPANQNYFVRKRMP